MYRTRPRALVQVALAAVLAAAQAAHPTYQARAAHAHQVKLTVPMRHLLNFGRMFDVL